MSNLTISNTYYKDLAAQHVTLASEVISILQDLRNGTIDSASVETRILKALKKANITHEKETKAKKLPNPPDTDPYRSVFNPGN